MSSGVWNSRGRRPGCIFTGSASTSATGGSFRLFRQGRDTNMEAGEKWQLSVIPADFRVPDFAPGAVMYQIFPDRFARSGSSDLTGKLQPFWVHESPDELPEYRPDAHGEVRNNDFFGGNFAGICEKLPYLQELGVGVLYLNPIFMAWFSGMQCIDVFASKQCL